MKVIHADSPNHGPRPAGERGVISCVVLHATADEHTLSAVRWCQTPAPANPNPVSYHVIVDRDGTIYQLVPLARRAWHAGASEFMGRPNVNDFSIGLSFANRNDGIEPYPEVQLSVGAALVASYCRIYPAITPDRITTHRAIAPTRKTDPAGPAFDLDAFKLRVLRELTQGGGCI